MPELPDIAAYITALEHASSRGRSIECGWRALFCFELRNRQLQVSRAAPSANCGESASASLLE